MFTVKEDKIYRFRIDIEKNGSYSNPNGSFFIIYCQLKHVNKDQYLCQEYIYFPFDETFTKADKLSTVYFDRIDNGVVFFRGPFLTAGYRKGQFEYWIMNPEDYKNVDINKYEKISEKTESKTPEKN